MLPKNNYFRFTSWLPEGSRFYAITGTVGHKFLPDLTSVIDWDDDEEQH